MEVEVVLWVLQNDQSLHPPSLGSMGQRQHMIGWKRRPATLVIVQTRPSLYGGTNPSATFIAYQSTQDATWRQSMDLEEQAAHASAPRGIRRSDNNVESAAE